MGPTSHTVGLVVLCPSLWTSPTGMGIDQAHKMKIDFEQLDLLVANETPAKAIVELLKADYAKGEAKRKHDKEAKIIARSGLGKPATKRDTERQNGPVVDDKTRQDATIDDTPRARLFREGSAALITLGRSERAARGLIAGWLKATHDDDQLVLATVLRARDLAVADVAGWVTATLKGKSGNATRNATMDAFDNLIARAEGGAVGGDPPMRDITPGRATSR